MDDNGCSQRWRIHLPEFKHSKRLSTPAAEDSKTNEAESKTKEEPHKSVTIAATSRYLTDRRYVVRKPLFSEEHVSILKMTQPQKTEEEKLLVDSRTEHSQMKYLTKEREAPIPKCDASLPTASIIDLGLPLKVPGLQGRSSNEEPSLELPFRRTKSLVQNLSSSILEVQRLNPPLRPQLTSTVLHPTYTPRSRDSKQCRTRLRLQEGSGFPKVHPKGGSVSSHQVDYWACAIPKALPPSPDRHSAGWNANKEYEALLDYTYPLRPGHVDNEWDSSELQGDSFLKTNPNMQDSGIELDHLCSSASLSGFNLSENGEEKSRDSSALCAGSRSPLQGFPRSSDGPLSSSPLSPTNPVGLFLDGSDCSRDKAEASYHNKDGYSRQHRTVPSTSNTFVHSTGVLPRSQRVCGDIDEDFWPLPEQLQELQQLSKQVREVTARLSRPGTASSESLDRDAVLSSITLLGKHQADDEGEGGDVREPKQDKDDEHDAAQTAGDNRDSGTFRRSCGAEVGPVGGALSQSTVREVEASVKELCGPAHSDVETNTQGLQEQSDSLMQYIQVFCSHLELLIQQLYALSQRMERLSTPTVDPGSMKTSLTEYQSFQREVTKHQPLTSCVLHAGHHLLSCISTTSPFLRDTLQLIERQSGALQTHSDHYFSSILSAMDSLTQREERGNRL